MRASSNVVWIAIAIAIAGPAGCSPSPLTPEQFRHDPPPAVCDVRVESTDGAGTLVSSYLYDADGRLLFAHTHPWYRGDAWEKYHYDKSGRLTGTSRKTEHAEMDAPCLTCSYQIRTVAESKLGYDGAGHVTSKDTSERTCHERSGSFPCVAASSSSEEIDYEGAEIVRWRKWRYARSSSDPKIMESFGPAGLAARYRIEDRRIVSADVNFCSDKACIPWMHVAMRYEGPLLTETTMSFESSDGSRAGAKKTTRYSYEGDRIVRIETRDSERGPEPYVRFFTYDPLGRLLTTIAGDGVPVKEGSRQTLVYKGACPPRLVGPGSPHAGDEIMEFLLLPAPAIQLPGAPLQTPLGWAAPFEAK